MFCWALQDVQSNIHRNARNQGVPAEWRSMLFTLTVSGFNVLNDWHIYTFDRLTFCAWSYLSLSVKGLTVCISKEKEAEEEQAWTSRVHHGIFWHMHAVSSVTSLPHWTIGQQKQALTTCREKRDKKKIIIRYETHPYTYTRTWGVWVPSRPYTAVMQLPFLFLPH